MVMQGVNPTPKGNCIKTRLSTLETMTHKNRRYAKTERRVFFFLKTLDKYKKALYLYSAFCF